LTRFAHLDLKFPIFHRNMHASIFYRNMHIVTCNMSAICILRCNIDPFLLNQKGLEEMSMLPKNFCNMHIARCNMHIAIESILPQTYLPDFSMRTTLLRYHYHLLSLKEIDGVRVRVVVKL